MIDKGILINGRFATLGTMSDLKNKFGEYSILIQRNEEGLSKVELRTLVKSVVPEADPSNSEENGMMFKVMKLIGLKVIEL